MKKESFINKLSSWFILDKNSKELKAAFENELSELIREAQKEIHAMYIDFKQK